MWFVTAGTPAKSMKINWLQKPWNAKHAKNIQLVVGALSGLFASSKVSDAKGIVVEQKEQLAQLQQGDAQYRNTAIPKWPCAL
mmetsp:Transcript_7256/g.19854  ORF Transcript_7256/g.19854 Transcript_7256/m.19854 type:complete len:83 (+) Transcript_7256:230-478(+)